MPFFDDSGPKPEEERNIFWRSTALVGDQLERMVLLNISWSAQILPALLAWAIPGLSAWVKFGLVLYSAVAIIPMSALLYAMLLETNRGTPLSLDLARDCFHQVWLASFMKLLPLLSLFYWLWLASSLSSQANLLFVDVVMRIGLLFLAVLWVHWGPLLVESPDLSALGIFKRSFEFFWRKPGATLLTAGLSFLALLLGLDSIGGFFLIVPVLVILIQIQHFQFFPLESINTGGK